MAFLGKVECLGISKVPVRNLGNSRALFYLEAA
jgi:hypothetical protein